MLAPLGGRGRLLTRYARAPTMAPHRPQNQPGEPTMHSAIDRRRFLLSLGAAAATQSLSSAVRAAMGPNDKFDLLIKGGDVLDPSQSLRGVRDIGIRNGVIEAVEADIPAERALKVHQRDGPARDARASSTCMRTRSRTARRSAFRPTSWCRTRARPPRCPRATRAPTTSPRSAASSSRRRARASTPSCTSPTSASPASRSPSSTTSTSRRPRPRRARSPRTPTSRSASRCACRRT